MPIYEFECKCGKISERWLKIVELKPTIRCSCGKRAKQIISYGATHRDADVVWMPSAIQVLQPDCELRTNPIQTRQQWKRYLKEHGLHCAG